jgi:hypothetical protein
MDCLDYYQGESMSYYENRGRVPSTNVLKYMEKCVRATHFERQRRTKRGYDGTKTMLSKAKSFVKNIFKRQKV